ncbi:MAG: DUF4275 family protein [Bacteroidota bacterium]|nr:DUF4275 family protein [Bacteroidota bacterium]
MNSKTIDRHKRILEGLLEEEGVQYEELSKVEIFNLQNLWKEKFKAKTLPNSESQLWLTFSPGSFTNYKEGEDADTKYRNQLVKEFLIWGGNSGYRCFGNKLPNLERLKRVPRDFGTVYDLYVSQKNLKWTYVYTHDDFCGPYFADAE